MSILFVMIGLIDIDNPPNSNPTLIDAFDSKNVIWIQYFIAFGSIIGLTSTISSSLLGQPRIFYSIAQDGLLP